MVEIQIFIQIAHAFPLVKEQPHFEKTSFTIGNKIFATLDIYTKQVCLKFSEIDQNIFCAFDPTVIFPVSNKWGKQGWTFINLDKIDIETCKDALEKAYEQVKRKKRI